MITLSRWGTPLLPDLIQYVLLSLCYMKFSAQILDMVIVIRDFNFEKENKEMKESNCLLDWVSNCKLSLNSLEKDILKQLKQDKF